MNNNLINAIQDFKKIDLDIIYQLRNAVGSEIIYLKPHEISKSESFLDNHKIISICVKLDNSNLCLINVSSCFNASDYVLEFLGLPENYSWFWYTEDEGYYILIELNQKYLNILEKEYPLNNNEHIDSASFISFKIQGLITLPPSEYFGKSNFINNFPSYKPNKISFEKFLNLMENFWNNAIEINDVYLKDMLKNVKVVDYENYKNIEIFENKKYYNPNDLFALYELIAITDPIAIIKLKAVRTSNYINFLKAYEQGNYNECLDYLLYITTSLETSDIIRKYRFVDLKISRSFFYIEDIVGVS